MLTKHFKSSLGLALLVSVKEGGVMCLRHFCATGQDFPEGRVPSQCLSLGFTTSPFIFVSLQIMARIKDRHFRHSPSVLKER